jgi:hypothetical protein
MPPYEIYLPGKPGAQDLYIPAVHCFSIGTMNAGKFAQVLQPIEHKPLKHNTYYSKPSLYAGVIFLKNLMNGETAM